MDTRIFGKFMTAVGLGSSALLALYLTFGLEKWRDDEEVELIYAMYRTIPTMEKKIAIEKIRLDRARFGEQLTWCAVAGSVVGVLGIGLIISSPMGVARRGRENTAEATDQPMSKTSK